MTSRHLMMLSALTVLGGCVASTSDNGANGQQPLVRDQSDDTYRPVDQVLLLSLDGFHPVDLASYVAAHPTSAMADIVGRGVSYTQATSSRPSDSFPGTLAMVTGGSPASTGVLYDVSWDDRLSPPGSDCSTRGTSVTYNQVASFDSNDVNTTINPAKLPRDADNGCAPVYPHQYLKVNTIYEVIKAAGLRTAACDKHATYEILNGPSGTGVDDLYTPEAEAGGAKKSITLTQGNDELKVQAVINELRGLDHTGATAVGVPAVLGMNFQSINIAQKIAGYVDGSGALTPGLAQTFDYVDGAIGRIMNELRAQGLYSRTLVVLTAKHANAPIDPAARRAIDPLLINATVDAVAPGLTARVTADTSALIWLTDHSRAADVAAAIQANATALGVDVVYSGAGVATALNAELAVEANRRPDVVISAVHGVVYTTATKLADHGGFSEEDVHVPLVLAAPGLHPATVSQPVDLRQVAPTVVGALGISPWSLAAVRKAGTSWLPGRVVTRH
jgi:hypothetical protein